VLDLFGRHECPVDELPRAGAVGDDIAPLEPGSEGSFEELLHL
jgi:hypothetical protein